MRRKLVAAACLGVVALLAACSSVLRARFPTEEEVHAKLARGMTAEQVLATFGEPPGHHWVDVKRGGKVPYIAPVAARIRPGEGYAGFTVYFDRGKVWDWEVIRLNPSYEHRLLALPRTKWALSMAGLVILLAAGYFVFRLVRANRSEREEFQNAYAAAEIATADLPPDFQFITRDTTLQMVFDKAGPHSRDKQFGATETANAAAFRAFIYELPGRGAVAIMPEPPFNAESQIRAVFYRRPQSVGDI